MSKAAAAGESTLALDPMVPLRATVREIKSEAHGISTFTVSLLDADEASHYRFQPGQFNMLYVPGVGESAISVSSDPNIATSLGHTIRFAGNVTRGIGRLRVGDMIGVRGPFGTAWPLATAEGKDLLIVAGGIGLAPLRPVIHQVMHRRDAYRRVLLLYGARTPADLLYTDEHERWRQCGIEIHVTVDRADDDWRGHVGVVPLLFYRIKVDAKDTVAFTCGPEVMMRFVIYEAIARRIPPESIWVSLERNMKCGLGFCGHCQFGPKFICREGPVLSFNAIEPLFNREEF